MAATSSWTERGMASVAITAMAMGVVPWALLVDASMATAQELTPEEDPKEVFAQAAQAYKEGRFQRAKVLFKRVFDLHPNPFAIYNIGRCHEELGELEDAARHYDWALDLGGLPESARLEAVERLDRLQSVLNLRKSWREGRREATFRVDRSIAVALTDAEHETEGESPPPIVPPPPTKPTDRTLTWIGVGTAGLGLIVTGVGLSVASNVSRDLDRQDDLAAEYEAVGTQALIRRDPNLATRAIAITDEINTLADDIEQGQTTSIILLITGGTLMVTGAGIIVYDLLRPTCVGDCEEDGVRIVPTPGGVGMVGRF